MKEILTLLPPLFLQQKQPHPKNHLHRHHHPIMNIYTTKQKRSTHKNGSILGLIMGPDHINFIHGFINVSCDNPSGRRHAIRRSSSNASLGLSLLSTYLATSTSNATAAILENEDGGGRNGNANRAVCCNTTTRHHQLQFERSSKLDSS